MEYNFSESEKKWQQYWAQNNVYKAEIDKSKPKYYALDMFPYPSGAGLHVGHPLGYIASDIVSRYKRLKGFNVLHPMGYDAFGLPAEQYAIQTGQHPAVTTEKNLKRYREQLDKLGFSFDWDREVKTCDPNYYKWTQWIFIKLFNSWYNPETNKAEPIETLIQKFETQNTKHENVGKAWKELSEAEKQMVLQEYRLAYLGEAVVNWCPQLGTVLANDEVKDGVSERGGYPVERKMMKQWSLRITAYAERLLKDLDGIDWSESIKEAQRNWIGRSEGTSLKFKVESSKFEIEVFTTRPDTVFGVSFVTLAPEHELVSQITTPENKKAVDEYVQVSKNRSERERQADVKRISGQFTGSYVLHPFTQKPIPVWIGDYVLAGYGTGAVMAVPAHDSRDYAFAKHFNLPITEVVKGGDISKEAYEAKEGTLVNSDFLNGMDVKQAMKKAIDEIEKSGLGKREINYRLRDAVFGRQRYWGEPIPIYYKDGIPYAVDEKDLPIELPEIDKFLPTETGEPPLARAKGWMYRPHSGSPQRGEGKASPSFHTADKTIWPATKELSREKRKDQTEAESVLWEHIRKEQLGYKIRRQHVIGTSIADFVCLEKKVVIEVDGKYHDFQKEQDELRTQQLELAGFSVVRYKNEEILADVDRVVQKLKSELDTKVLPNGEDLGGAAFPLETTTMPGWAGSSWYYLRYMDAKNPNEFVSKEAADYWQNVDLYIGGAEHATGHLLYVRFWTKFLADLGYINIQEPAKKLINQGMIQGVSAFVYGFSTGLTMPFLDNLDVNGMPNAQKYIVPKSSYDNFNKGLKDQLIESIQRNELERQKQLGFNSITLAEKMQSVHPVHVDISLVDPISNELDVQGFKNSERYKSLLIDEIFCEEDGKYICGRESEKMSKSKYNVVNPDDIVRDYSADTLRLYEMFLGPLEQHKPWNTNGITGVHGFLKKLWRLYHSLPGEGQGGVGAFNVSNDAPTKEELKALHKTIKKVVDDIERFSFNTSVSNFMICVNELTDLKCNKKAILEPLAIIIAPYAPHIAEMLWAKLQYGESFDINAIPHGYKSIVNAQFPEFKEEYLVESSFKYPVSINGKTKFFHELDLALSKEDVEKEVLALEQTQKILEGKAPKKIIVVPNKIVNIVV